MKLESRDCLALLFLENERWKKELAFIGVKNEKGPQFNYINKSLKEGIMKFEDTMVS
jgi:hypothetical protein